MTIVNLQLLSPVPDPFPVTQLSDRPIRLLTSSQDTDVSKVIGHVSLHKNDLTRSPIANGFSNGLTCGTALDAMRRGKAGG
jgi:hypothetical protein